MGSLISDARASGEDVNALDARYQRKINMKPGQIITCSYAAMPSKCIDRQH